MLGFLGIIGFLVFVVFGIMWIVSLVKKNGKAVRNIIISVVGLVVMIVASLIGVGSAVNEVLSEVDDGPKKVEETADDDSGDETTNEPETEAEDEEQTEFSIGEKVVLDGQVVEITEVEKSSGGDFDKPKDGKEFVIVHVSIENDGDEEISYNPFNFKMKNSNGQIEDTTFTTIDSDTALSSGDLASGGNVSGTLAFEQPIDDDELQLIFEASFWSDKKIVFNLQ